MRLTEARAIDQGAAVRLGWDDGSSARFHAIWLRDNALDPATRAPGNGQRLVTILDIPADTVAAEVALLDDGNVSLRFLPEDKTVTFPAAWLAAHAYDRGRADAPGWTPQGRRRWGGELDIEALAGEYAAIAADRRARHRWLAGVRSHGFALLRGVPVRSGAVCEVAALFGYVRETNYGRWFDVRAQVDPSNLAYTNLGLQAHTDNPYRDPPPGLQLLACLQNAVEGGLSMVVDGFRVAEMLQAEDQGAFDLLSRHCARFGYAGDAGVRLAAKKPVIELGADGELVAIRFNNRSAAPMVDIPYASMPAWYAAYRRFAELVEDPALAARFRLQPGELFIVDNTRVLHARTGFSGGGSRWLQGCYADRDGLLSTLAALDEQFGEVA